jgi:transaldolase
MPEATLRALAEHGEVGPVLARDGGDCEQVIAAHVRAGIDVDALAAQLQVDGARSFVDSWQELLGAIDKKSSKLK